MGAIRCNLARQDGHVAELLYRTPWAVASPQIKASRLVGRPEAIIWTQNMIGGSSELFTANSLRYLGWPVHHWMRASGCWVSCCTGVVGVADTALLTGAQGVDMGG